MTSTLSGADPSLHPIRGPVTMAMKDQNDTATAGDVSPCDDSFAKDEDEEILDEDLEKDEKSEDEEGNSSSVYSSQATFGHACGIWFNPSVEIISNDLRDLPKAVRELVWTDMIGNDSNAEHFDRNIKETPEAVQSAMESLDKELRGMFSFGDTALRRARIQCPQYVDDPSFRVRFLRAERFHVKNAATRLLRHFEEKKLLFGEHCLGRDVLLSDLNEDDMAYLECTGHQISSSLDRHGRTMEICNFHLLKNTNVLSKTSENRARWYTLMHASEDEFTQQNGVVRIIDTLDAFTSGAAKKFDADYFKMSMKMYHAIPIKFVATYAVTDDDLWDPILNQYLRFLPMDWRVRTRVLKGSYDENLYDLKCVGVPAGVVSLDSKHHLEWLEKRRQVEGVKRRRLA